MLVQDIIFYLVLVAVALAICILWYLKQRYYGLSPYSLKGKNIKQVIDHALKELNVKVEWQKDNDNQIVHYTYQGGHFNIMLEKGSPFARLTFLFFYETELDNIEIVRIVCNLCNLNTDACRIVYTVDEKKGKVEVHLISVLPVNDKGMKELLERVMGDAFRWQNTFISKIKENKKKYDNTGIDEEKSNALYERDIQLIREQEITHQDAGPDWHENLGNMMKLKSLLSTAMGLTEIIPIRLILSRDKDQISIDDPDQILEYEISKPLLNNTSSFVYESAMGKLDYYDPQDPVNKRHLSLDFEAVNTTKDTLYYRITISLIPLSLSKKINMDSEQHCVHMTSVLIGFDLTPPEKRQAHYRYVWKEAIAKMKNGDNEKMTDEEKVLANIQDSHIGYNYFHGRSLYLHKRYYEALLPLTDALHAVTSVYDHHDHHIMGIIEELAYYIGCCYAGLSQYDRASYYLQLTLPTTHQSYIEAYVNCLVNGGDYRAMDILVGLQASLQTMLNNMDSNEEDGEDGKYQGPSKEQLTKFLNFIKRRLAYILVDKGRFHEAEKLLKQLLDDPDNSDFALSELAFIQKHK